YSTKADPCWSASAGGRARGRIEGDARSDGVGDVCLDGDGVGDVFLDGVALILELLARLAGDEPDADGHREGEQADDDELLNEVSALVAEQAEERGLGFGLGLGRVAELDVGIHWVL